MLSFMETNTVSSRFSGLMMGAGHGQHKTTIKTKAVKTGTKWM
jgi:hypothetical protein